MTVARAKGNAYRFLERKTLSLSGIGKEIFNFNGDFSSA
jgi:hypothetical protein